MARKRKGQKPRKSRKKQAFNVLNFAETLVISNASTRALFGTNLDHFLFDGWLPFGDYQDGMVRGDEYGSGNSWALSAKEIFSGLTGVGSGFRQAGNYPDANTAKGMFNAIGYNFRTNGAKELPIILLTPVAFRLGKKLMRKPINLTNKGLKMLGVNRDVKV